MGNNIKITVVCITYNHIAFIRDVLEGILSQRVNVPFEIIVHDDASTDGTADVIREYAERYPDKIIPILQKENQCSQGINVRRTFVHPLIKGKYYAWTEGDDVWTYPGKLQAQYDFMEGHTECSLCYHNALDYQADTDLESLLITEQPSGYLTDEQIIATTNGNYPTTSVFARTADVLSMPDAFYHAGIGDHPLRLYLATKGKVYYMNRAWAIRNYKHAQSWTLQMINAFDKYRDYCVKYMDFLGFYNEYTNSKYYNNIRLMYARSFIARFLIETEEKVLCEQWIEMAQDYYSRLSERAKLYTLDELIEEGLQRCSDYEDYMIQQVINPYVEKKKKIYIYGAGVEATRRAVVLFKYYIEFEGFLVTSMEDQEPTCLGKPVYEFANIQLDEDVIVWIGLNRKNKDQVISGLKERGIQYLSFSLDEHKRYNNR